MIARAPGVTLLAAALSASLAFSAEAVAKPHPKKRRHAKEPPVAYYLADYGTAKAATRDEVVMKCRARRAAELKRHPELGAYGGEPCDETVVVVRGPFDRKAKAKDPYDDAKTYVYRGSDGQWYDVNGEAPCFVAGTRVATPDGDEPIESLREGDVVWSWDFASRSMVRGVVERTKRRVVSKVDTLTLEDGRTVTSTPNHPFFSTRALAWVPAGELGRGDAVMVIDEATRSIVARALDGAPVATSSARAEGITVYELTVSPHHDYFAAGVLVHNY